MSSMDCILITEIFYISFLNDKNKIIGRLENKDEASLSSSSLSLSAWILNLMSFDNQLPEASRL